jgi:hypothetical protein
VAVGVFFVSNFWSGQKLIGAGWNWPRHRLLWRGI